MKSGYSLTNLRFQQDPGLSGKKVSKVTYITPDGSYVYEFGDKAPLVKKAA